MLFVSMLLPLTATHSLLLFWCVILEVIDLHAFTAGCDQRTLIESDFGK